MGKKISEVALKQTLSGNELIPAYDPDGNTPDIKVKVSDVRGTQFSGSYNDLTNRPTLFDGNYNSLSNRPTVPDASVDTTNKLIKVKGSDGNYYVVSAVKLEKPSTPTITVDGSDTDASRKVTIASTTGATIYYTTDGSAPTASSTKYTSEFYLSANTSGTSLETTITLKAIAIKNGESSAVSEKTGIKLQRKVAQPTITADSSTNDYSTSRTITLACATTGATMYYTTNGDEPTTSSTKYTAAFSLGSTKTIKVIAVLNTWNSNTNSKEIVVGKLKMYKGLVTDAPTTEAIIKSLTAVEQDKMPLTFAVTTDGQYKVCVAYDKSLADLTSIKDGNGTEYLNDFVKTTVGAYKVYTMKNAGNQKDITYTFK